MKKNEETVLKLINQEESSSVDKNVILKKATILNIDETEFEKIIEKLNLYDYVLIFGRRLELTDKGKRYLG